MQQPILVEDLSILYECRIVVLLETKPQSNKYYQMNIKDNQFRELSTLLSSFCKKNKMGGINVDTSNATYSLPDTIQSIKEEK